MAKKVNANEKKSEFVVIELDEKGEPVEGWWTGYSTVSEAMRGIAEMAPADGFELNNCTYVVCEVHRRSGGRVMAKTRLGPNEKAILAHIVKSGKRGCTTDEVEAALGIIHQSASPAVISLRDKHRLIQNSGKMRSTRTGRPAVVYVASLPPSIDERLAAVEAWIGRMVAVGGIVMLRDAQEVE